MSIVPHCDKQPKEQLYLFLKKLKQDVQNGMGDVEFHFEFLCINSKGEQCIVCEDYIQYNGNPQGVRYIEDENLCNWSIQSLQPDQDHYDRKECLRLYEQAQELIQPPFFPKIS